MGNNFDNELNNVQKQIDIYNRKKRLCVLLFPFIIGIPLYIKYNRILNELNNKNSELLSSMYKSIAVDLKDAQLIIKGLLENDTYLTSQKRIEILYKFYLYILNIQSLLSSKSNHSSTINKYLSDSLKYFLEIQDWINSYNESFIKKRLIAYDYLFKHSPFPLDENQKRAIITDDKHNLVVAGAGSGKTEVLINRIAYLIERRPDTVKSQKILALAFQRKAAQEMRDRLKKRYNVEVEIKTFHALGKEIIEKAYVSSNKEPPKLLFPGENFENNYRKHINSIYEDLLKIETFNQELTNYLTYFRDEERTEADFIDKTEYFNYMCQLTYTALDGTRVKSYAERQILNFFLTHSINGSVIKVEYEKPASWMSYKDKNGRNQIPKPDFFLPQFNLYLEHWAIDENGRVPEWFSGSNPTKEYKEGMEQKKKRFQSQTKYGLIEIFGYELINKSINVVITTKLINKLKEKYPDKQFNISPLSTYDIINNFTFCKESIKSLPGDIARFITIAKTYNLAPDAIQKRLKDEKWTNKQLAFGNLALIVYQEYERYLRTNNSIDFSDMINISIQLVNENNELYRNTIDHILIDEYQDISPQRYQLIKALMDKNIDCKLFCVGDDWQSIMGFTGSDVDYFIKFESYFDHPTRTDLTINYRSTKPIVDAGAAIIKQNQNVQIQKITKASNQNGKPLNVILFSLPDKDYYVWMARHCVDCVEQLLQSGYKPKDIMILARITTNYYLKTALLEYSKLKNIPISVENRINYVPFMSVHKSKGLQARAVFILNVNDELYGFPCRIEDPRIFEPAITGRKKDRDEEERRLFYVAVTRAKEIVYIYAQESIKSKFIDDISKYTNVISATPEKEKIPEFENYGFNVIDLSKIDLW